MFHAIFHVTWLRIFLLDQCLICTTMSHEIFFNMETFLKNSNFHNEKLFCSFWEMSFYACGWQLLWCPRDLCGQIRLIPASVWKPWHLSYWNVDFLESISYVYNGNPSTGKMIIITKMTLVGCLEELHHWESVKSEQSSCHYCASLLCYVVRY